MKAVVFIFITLFIVSPIIDSIGDDSANVQTPSSHLIEKLMIEKEGGRIIQRQGDLKWEPKAVITQFPTQWRTAQLVVEWKDKSWQKWLSNQGLSQPKYDGDRSQSLQFDALL